MSRNVSFNQVSLIGSVKRGNRKPFILLRTSTQSWEGDDLVNKTESFLVKLPDRLYNQIPEEEVGIGVNGKLVNLQLHGTIVEADSLILI